MILRESALWPRDMQCGACLNVEAASAAQESEAFCMQGLQGACSHSTWLEFVVDSLNCHSEKFHYHKWAHMQEWNSTKLEPVMVDFLIPFELFGTLWRSPESQRLKSLFGRDGRPGLSSWWRNALERSSWAQVHPDLDREKLDKTFGILVFCDGAEQMTNQEQVFWLWQSAHAKGGNTYDALLVCSPASIKNIELQSRIVCIVLD